jgi:hypothetical protein
MKILELELAESEIETFHLLLEFLYTTNVSIEEYQILSLLELADRFTVTPLKEACSHSLGNNINNENLIKLLEIVSKYHVTELKLKIVDFIAKHIK